MSVFLQTFPYALSPFADFAVYPFTILSLSHESNYILSPVSPPYESPDLGALLGGYKYGLLSVDNKYKKISLQ